MILLLSLGAKGELLSLFPAEDPVEELSFGSQYWQSRSWNPWGLSDASVLQIKGERHWSSLVFVSSLELHRWGDWSIPAVDLSLLVKTGGNLQCGLHYRNENREAGSFSVLLRSAGKISPGLRFRLYENVPARSSPDLFLLTLKGKSGTLDLLLEKRQGLKLWMALSAQYEGLESRILLGQAPWQGLELAWRGRRLRVAFLLRLHPWLGASRGLSLEWRR
ncbi:MAG: hypothetical protein QGH30_06095 [Candidatus Krumholzibacteria bacterium]|nr:hypothetical protein [Candidatus Krumholzibacteria bacterium]